MTYKRDYIATLTLTHLMQLIDKYNYNYRLVTVFYNETDGYVAILEKEEE